VLTSECLLDTFHGVVARKLEVLTSTQEPFRIFRDMAERNLWIASHGDSMVAGAQQQEAVAKFETAEQAQSLSQM
jgi:hypothetical protein